MQRDFEGTIVIFALGSSIIPFLDLIAYLIRLNVYNVSLKKGKPAKIFEDENFLYFSNPNFKLVLFYSVKSLDESYGVDLCKKLADFCSQNNLTNFELNLRISNEGQKRWDSDFIKSKVRIDNAKKAYIGAIDGEDNKLKEMVIKSGIPKENIVII